MQLSEMHGTGTFKYKIVNISDIAFKKQKKPCQLAHKHFNLKKLKNLMVIWPWLQEAAAHEFS